MRYKAAVVGCGRIGFKFDKDAKRRYISTHTGAYRHIKEVDLVAVCDKNKRKLRECLKASRTNGYTDLKKMLKKEKIDILSICTPPENHYGAVREAARSKSIKAIFCEKPLASNIEDAEKMVKLCRQKKIILQVDHQRRFDALHNNIKKLIKNKKLGNVQHVNFYYTRGINNTGSHMFDLLRFFFGDADWVEAFFSKNRFVKKGDSNLDGILKFKNGLLATFKACDVRKFLIFELDCIFENGRGILKNSGFGADFYRIKENRQFSGYKELRKGKKLCNTRYKRDFMINAVKHLIECAREGKESVSSGEDGLKALKIIQAAIHSARNNGRRVFIR